MSIERQRPAVRERSELYATLKVLYKLRVRHLNGSDQHSQHHARAETLQCTHLVQEVSSLLTLYAVLHVMIAVMFSILVPILDAV